MKRDFWGIDGEIWGWNRYIISNFHSLHPLQNRTNVQTKGGGGVKGLLNNVQKTALFLMDGFPKCCDDDHDGDSGGVGEMADRVFSGRGRAHCAHKTNLRRRPCNYLHRATPCGSGPVGKKKSNVSNFFSGKRRDTTSCYYL